MFISICIVFNVEETANAAGLIDGRKRESFCPGEQEAFPPPVPNNISLDSTLRMPFFLAAGKHTDEHTPRAEQQRCSEAMTPRLQPHLRDSDAPVAPGSGLVEGCRKRPPAW